MQLTITYDNNNTDSITWTGTTRSCIQINNGNVDLYDDSQTLEDTLYLQNSGYSIKDIAVTIGSAVLTFDGQQLQNIVGIIGFIIGLLLLL